MEYVLEGKKYSNINVAAKLPKELIIFQIYITK